MQMWTMKQGGVAVPDDMLWEASPYPVSKKFQEKIQQQAEQAQAAQEAEQKDKEQINEVLHAKATLDYSRAEEQLSKIKYDAALSEETLARAQEERSRGVLEEIRAAKEFQEMDINNATNILEMIRGVEEEHRLRAADTILPQPGAQK